MAALPAGFPLPPKPPPAASQADPKVLADHLTAVYEWQKKLVAALS